MNCPIYNRIFPQGITISAGEDIQLERLLALRSYVIIDTEAEAAFDDLALLAARICGVPLAAVSLVLEARQWFKASAGFGVRATPLTHSFCAQAIEHNDIFIVTDASTDSRFSDNSLMTGKFGFRFYAGVPIRSHDEIPMATLCVVSPDPRPGGLELQQTEALIMLAGQVEMQLAPALVIVGFILAPTMYHMLWDAAQAAPLGKREEMLAGVAVRENILLLQLRIGILFPLFLTIALKARGRNAGMHKRMMFLATAMALPAGIDRIPWLLHSLPTSPLSPDLYTLLAVAPMFVWDVIRNRSMHPAYVIWLAVNIPFALAVHGLWDTPVWHQTAQHLMGVG